MKQHRILFVDHTAVMGGAELSLLDLATAYADTSKVLLFQDGILRERLEQAGVKVQVAPVSNTMLNLRTSGGLSSLVTIPELWQIAGYIDREAKGYDLILANSQKAFITAALASLRGSPAVLWYLHDILTAGHFSQVNRLVAIFLANQFAAKVLVNSQATGKAFVVAGGKAKLTRVVYNGFDPQKFDLVNFDDVKKIREQLGIGNGFLVGLFSRFSYWKGQHILLEAIKHSPKVHVLLVGTALFGEQEYVTELKTLAETPELKGRVHWLGFRDDIPTLMKACDIIVHTSTEPEPFGRVIVEGQLAQKPVIASAAGGALELIKDGVNGYLFPPEDAIALGKLIEKLIKAPSLAKTLGQQGYVDAQQNFSWETILASFEQALSN
ncbi:glycosyltransferase family 1 protein [Pleurocapsa sp. CCALA 161]|uniref:glycosyltransferase family 4 protein n=1 Tax=Pleurocapsa sp. CCALA 161 TaxID=2107688 RepID=UPI000D060B97|nr:glycosyltransferase family 4 protein [Pleurocapsa sp. CCALA 161]PSB09546.1 glycosyltransferase family 1 protein [Pleurocapsa sp. CCALA 161]